MGLLLAEHAHARLAEHARLACAVWRYSPDIIPDSTLANVEHERHDAPERFERTVFSRVTV